MPAVWIDCGRCASHCDWVRYEGEDLREQLVPRPQAEHPALLAAAGHRRGQEVFNDHLGDLENRCP
jgi:hypothetical protein